MEKKKVWRWSLIGLFAVAFVMALSFALVNVIPAHAEGGEVLSGNTATYEIINDEREKLLWTYKRSTNEWTSANSKSDSNYTTPTAEQANKLTLKVTGAGDVAFKWKLAGHWAYLAIAVKHYKAADVEGGDLSSAEFTYVLNRGYQEIVFDKETDYGGDFINTEKATSYDADGHDVTITCDAGDYITIEALWGRNSGSYGVAVKGLTLPTKEFTVNAKIADGQDSLGTLKADRDNETGTSTLAVHRGYDESVTFTAVSSSEKTYVYWTGPDETKVSANPDLTISGIAEGNDNTTYTAHFVKEEDMKPVSGVKDEGGNWFTVDENGKASLDFSVAQANDFPSLTFGFVIPEGGGYLEFDYTYFMKTRLNAIYLRIENIRQDTNTNGGAGQFSYTRSSAPTFFAVKTPNDGKGSPKPFTYAQYIGVGGYYEGMIEIQMGGTYGFQYAEGDEFSISNIHCPTELEKHENMTFDFDEEIMSMTMTTYDKNDPVEITPNEPVNVPVGLTNILFTAKLKNKTKTSELDPTKLVGYYFNSFSGDFTNYEGSTWSRINKSSSSGTFYFTFLDASDAMFTIGRSYTPSQYDDDGEMPYTFEKNEAKVTVSHIEQAPISFSTTAMTDGQGSEKEVEEGGFIGMPFGHSNSITLNIKKFENVTLDDLSICVDGEEKKNEAQEFPSAFLFPLQISGTQKIEISYLKDDDKYIWSESKFTFSVGETVEGTIDDLIDHTPKETAGSVEITNDEQNAWMFDPVLSSEEEYAFSSIMDMEKSDSSYHGQVAVSNLSFTMTGAQTGGLSFEFRSEGYFQESGIFWKAHKVGQLWYRNGTPFTQTDNSTVGEQSGDSWTETLDNATWLSRPKAVKDGGMEYASSAVALEDGWYQVSVPIQENTPLYLGFLVYGELSNPEPLRCRASIRNVRLATGNKTATLKIGADAGEGSSATANVSDAQHTATKEGASVTVTAGSLVKLSATVGSADTFYGWSVNGQLVSTEKETSVFVNDDSTITAWIAPDGTYNARADGTFYKTIEEAAEGASRGQTIYLLKDKLTVTRSFTIEEGVTLLLPYDETNKLTAMGAAGTTAENKIAWLGTTYKTPYRSLTVTGDTTITVKGTLAVGGVVGYPGSTEYMGHTSGHYSEIILEQGSKIQVVKGGVMDVYGRVWGGEGHEGADMGTIDVAKGGKVYEPFLILDFAGGTNAAGMFLGDNPITPFKRYAMINIEVPMTINYGGALVGHASLYASKQYFSLDQTFIGDDSVIGSGTETFVMLSGEGSKVTITYDPKKQVGSPAVSDCTEGIGLIKMVFEGGAKFSYMMFSAMGITVPTNPVYFSIPYNYEVEMNGAGAQYETRTDFMIMPGAKVTLGEGATLTLNANAYVYDGLVQGNLPNTSKAAYPTADRLAQGGYSKSGNFIVNGTLKIGQKTTVQKFELFEPSEPFVPQIIPALFLGIIQTTGTTGRIEIPAETVLEGQILNGVAGNAYYFAYTTTARVWDKVHNRFGDLEAGHSYTATGDGTFTLTELKYKTTAEGEENQTLPLNETLKGSWKIEHEEHTFDWTIAEEEKAADFFNEGNAKTVTRDCQELGCNDRAEKYLLNGAAKFSNKTYKGEAYDLNALFEELFGVSVEETGVGATVTLVQDTVAKNAKTYQIKISLADGFFVSGETFVSELTFDFTIDKADLDVKILDQSKVYDGGVPNPTSDKGTGYEATLLGEDRTLDVSISVADGAAKAGKYNLTAVVTSDNYNIHIIYTGEGHSTFEITKAALTVSVGGTSPQNEDLKPAISVTGYKASDKNLLHEDSDWLEFFDVTLPEKTAEPQTYTVTASWKQGKEIVLDNYTVTFENGNYTVTSPVFGGVKFTLDGTPQSGLTFSTEYDGKTHTVALQGAEGMEAVWSGKEPTQKNAGTYTITVKLTKESYSQEFTATFTITPHTVKVELLSQEKTYDGQNAAPSNAENVGWKFAEGSKLFDGDKEGDLHLALNVESNDKNAKAYTVTASAEEGNYKVEFVGGNTTTYTIHKKAVAVTIKNVGSTYGDGSTTAAHANDFEYDKSLIVSGDTVTVTLNFGAVDLTKANTAGYPITASATANNENYTFTFNDDAKWTVAPKPVTVVVARKTVTYSDTAAPAAPTEWSLAEGSALVGNDDLGVHLSKGGTSADADNYEIVATWDNKNYAVTFKGLTVEDNGGYVIEKLDISDDDNFMIFWTQGDVTPDGDSTIRVKFAGQTITLAASASYVDGKEEMHSNMTVTLDKATIDGLGTFTVTATIEDKNYSGSKVFTVIVTNADGYTEELIAKLEELKEHAEGISADALKADDFDDLKAIKTILDGLTEDERKAAAEALEKYEALVEAWEDLADIDSIVETAQEIADAPIAGLLEAAAMLTALAGLAYIALKGGIL